jgi:hypothetical protein
LNSPTRGLQLGREGVADRLLRAISSQQGRLARAAGSRVELVLEVLHLLHGDVVEVAVLHRPEDRRTCIFDRERVVLAAA